MSRGSARPVARILVPTDFSRHSEAAWSLAQQLAAALGADLALLHVLGQTPLDVERQLREEDSDAEERTRAATHQLGILRDNQVKPAKAPRHVFRAPFPVGEFSEAGRAWAALLQEWAQSVRGTGSNVTLLLRVGEPSSEILQTIREEKVDLVVLSTRGRSDIPRLLLGSVADKVIRMADCPVLTVREPAPD